MLLPPSITSSTFSLLGLFPPPGDHESCSAVEEWFLFCLVGLGFFPSPRLQFRKLGHFMVKILLGLSMVLCFVWEAGGEENRYLSSPSPLDWELGKRTYSLKDAVFNVVSLLPWSCDTMEWTLVSESEGIVSCLQSAIELLWLNKNVT